MELKRDGKDFNPYTITIKVETRAEHLMFYYLYDYGFRIKSLFSTDEQTATEDEIHEAKKALDTFTVEFQNLTNF